MESRSRGVLDAPRSRGMTKFVGGASVCCRSDHAIADREGVMQLGARDFALVRGSHSIDQMPRPKLIAVAWVCREPQLELVLGLTRQRQDHEPLGGPIIQYDRPLEDAAAIVTGGQRALQLGKFLISVGAQFDLGVADLR